MQTAHPAVQSLRPSTTIKQLIVRVQAEAHMAEQWATRVIVAFQSACWCVAILLLLSRGVANLHDAKDTSGRQYNIGVGLVVLAGLMVVASPVIVIARAYDRRRYRSVERFPDLGLPPRYEDVVSQAPSYTSLFDIEETIQLQEIDTAAVTVVPAK